MLEIEYRDEYNEIENGYWLACGIGKRDYMCLIELDGVIGWCSSDRIEVIDEY